MNDKQLTPEQFIENAKAAYKEIFKDKYNESRALESAKKLLEAAGGCPITATKSLEGIVARLKSRMKNFDSLSELKEMLFDAPSEVKESFNTIVKYFSVESGFDDDVSKGMSVYRLNVSSDMDRDEISDLPDVLRICDEGSLFRAHTKPKGPGASDVTYQYFYVVKQLPNVSYARFGGLDPFNKLDNREIANLKNSVVFDKWFEKPLNALDDIYSKHEEGNLWLSF